MNVRMAVMNDGVGSSSQYCVFFNEGEVSKPIMLINSFEMERFIEQYQKAKQDMKKLEKIVEESQKIKSKERMEK
jgi:predicted RND superfamily exporter protein